MPGLLFAVTGQISCCCCVVVVATANAAALITSDRRLRWLLKGTALIGSFRIEIIMFAALVGGVITRRIVIE